MFTIFAESVYIGYSLDELEKIRDALSSEGIKYKIQTVNHSGQWGSVGTRRGEFGSLGLDMNHEKQYNVLVNNRDYNKAKSLVAKMKD